MGNRDGRFFLIICVNLCMISIVASSFVKNRIKILSLQKVPFFVGRLYPLKKYIFEKGFLFVRSNTEKVHFFL